MNFKAKYITEIRENLVESLQQIYSVGISNMLAQLKSTNLFFCFLDYLFFFFFFPKLLDYLSMA